MIIRLPKSQSKICKTDDRQKRLSHRLTREVRYVNVDKMQESF